MGDNCLGPNSGFCSLGQGDEYCACACGTTLAGLACDQCAAGFTFTGARCRPCLVLFLPLLAAYAIHAFLFLRKFILLFQDPTIQGRSIKQAVVSLAVISSLSGCMWTAAWLVVVSRDETEIAANFDCSGSISFSFTLKSGVSALCFVILSWLEVAAAHSNNRVFEYRRLKIFVIGFSVFFLLLLIPSSMYVTVTRRALSSPLSAAS
jgi:hypothetical protein